MKWVRKLESLAGVSNLLDRLFHAFVVIVALLWGCNLTAGQEIDQPTRMVPQPQCVQVLVDGPFLTWAELDLGPVDFCKD